MTRSAAVLLVLALAAMALGDRATLAGAHQTTPVPKGFPPNWFGWCTATITKDGADKPLWGRGQQIVYSTEEQYTCRYDEHDVVNANNKRPMDFCDYTAGQHYSLKDQRGDPPCASIADLSEDTLVPLSFPEEFVQNAVYVGVRNVPNECSSPGCPVFSANITIAGRAVTMDVWTSTKSGLVTGIKINEIGTPLNYNWNFVGVTTTIPDVASVCTAARYQCVKSDWKCSAIRDSMHRQEVVDAIGWVCSPTVLDCSPIKPGGEHFEPNTLYDHCDWAFNAYYQKHKMTQGEGGCFFGGIAQLVPPNRTLDSPHVTMKRGTMFTTWPPLPLDVACPSDDVPEF